MSIYNDKLYTSLFFIYIYNISLKICAYMSFPKKPNLDCILYIFSLDFSYIYAPSLYLLLKIIPHILQGKCRKLYVNYIYVEMHRPTNKHLVLALGAHAFII